MKRQIKILLLALALLALAFGLTGCYVPPDEVTNNTDNMYVGNSTIPFATIAPTATVTPTAEPTATPIPQATAVPTEEVNWDSWAATGTPTERPPATTRPVAIITPNPTDVPTATPASLQMGSSGAEVRRLQQRLKDLKYYTGSVDGDFGAGTKAAVEAFQRNNGLSVDGKAGPRTTAKLYSSSAKAAPAGTATPRATATPKATTVPRTDVYLALGSTGNQVTTLQTRLIALGYLTGVADGSYGEATQAAVEAYQNRVKGLWADGKAGPETLASIYSNTAPKASSVVAQIGSGQALQEGDSGAAVRALQQQLKKLGYYSGTVDGDFGSGTASAVLAFQKANGLSADGKAGTGTFNRLYSPNAIPNGGSSGGDSGGVSSTGYVTLEQGSEGEAVKKLQQALKNQGYYSGSVDGKYGPGTVAAVILFQQSRNIQADGKAGPATQRLLYNTSTSITYTTLRPGDRGTAVTNLQYTLYELGYYSGSIDGIYGDTTSDAVRSFQIRNKVDPVDGVAGSATLQKLYSASAIPDKAPNTTYTTLRPGDIGEEVLELKDMLVQLGYMVFDNSNVYTEATRLAVIRFQTYNGLNADGIAGPDTQAKLYGPNPLANPEK
ncbi:MAG: peptidoglycan-binding protein [Clostridia bacterium]|nr:peptidoglycan-binding protein [Clostridia bacterium]